MTNYRTLLVHVPEEENFDDVVGVATALADRFNAHLTGLHVIPPIDLTFTHGLPLAIAGEIGTHQRTLAQKLAVRFERATRGGGFVAEWRLVDDVASSPERVLTELGNTADLILACQSRDSDQRGSRTELTARVLGSAGRPMCLVPPGTAGRSSGERAVGDRIFIAWDGERAATRALFAALPLLQRAEAVRLQRVNAPQRDARHTLGATEVLADTLARHDVDVELFHSDARDAEVGVELLGLASDWSADLIVAGGQEHGALREFLFGSTTRHLLENTGVPVFMSS